MGLPGSGGLGNQPTGAVELPNQRGESLRAAGFEPPLSSWRSQNESRRLRRYSLAGCTPALPTSASQAGFNMPSASRIRKPPPHEGWEFSTGAMWNSQPELTGSVFDREIAALLAKATAPSRGPPGPGSDESHERQRVVWEWPPIQTGYCAACKNCSLKGCLWSRVRSEPRNLKGAGRRTCRPARSRSQTPPKKCRRCTSPLQTCPAGRPKPAW